MVTIKELYFEPNNFIPSKKEIMPVKFNKGINFIIGEKSKDDPFTGEKMNSVGKSLLIDAIDFCFLKEVNDSRINRIPNVIMNHDVYICLELEIEKEEKINNIVIKRNKDDSKPIIIIENGKEKNFDDVKNARRYLEFLFYTQNKIEDKPSLRNILSILIRDENTVYRNIIKPHAGQRNFSDLVKPHLYFFGFDIIIFGLLKDNFNKVDKINKTLATIRSDFKDDGININEIKSYINDLQHEVDKLNIAVQSLKPGESKKQIRDELGLLSERLEKLFSEKAAKDYLVNKIKKLPKVEKINTKQIQILYNQFKLGLGDMVKKSFDQVLEFKERIDMFQNKLMTEKLKMLQVEISELDKQINQIDNKISDIYKKTNAKKEIHGLEEAIRLKKEKNDKLDRYSSKYRILEEKVNDKKLLEKSKSELIDKIDISLVDLSKEIKNFEEDLKMIHEYIAGNQQCQFDIKTHNKRKEYIEIDYRIKLDRGSGVDRVKTYIYDILLMLNEFTSKRHPGFLIHDNIFASVGRDDLIKSLNYLNSQKIKGKNFQYITTINKDEFDLAVEKFNFDYKDNLTCFTRQKPFLRCEYREI